MSNVVISGLSLHLDGRAILNDVDLQISAGELVVILGSNGAGKSSLMRAALGLIAPTAGLVAVDGVDVESLDPVEKAMRLSYLPQKRPMAWPILVKDVVALGRFAYGASVGSLRGKDKEAVDKAINACDLSGFQNRRIDTLSGGETTRVHCARAFAAEASLLFADEPTTALDPRHQLEIMQLLKGYVSASRGALVVAHEPALAARYADRLVWMKEGAIIADGPPSVTLTTEMMKTVYGVHAEVTQPGGHPLVDVMGTAG